MREDEIRKEGSQGLIEWVVKDGEVGESDGG